LCEDRKLDLGMPLSSVDPLNFPVRDRRRRELSSIQAKALPNSVIRSIGAVVITLDDVFNMEKLLYSTIDLHLYTTTNKSDSFSFLDLNVNKQCSQIY
jgi:hypothetical protein